MGSFYFSLSSDSIISSASISDFILPFHPLMTSITWKARNNFWEILDFLFKSKIKSASILVGLCYCLIHAPFKNLILLRSILWNDLLPGVWWLGLLVTLFGSQPQSWVSSHSSGISNSQIIPFSLQSYIVISVIIPFLWA